MGINLLAHRVREIKRIGTSQDAKSLPVFRLVTSYPGVDPIQKIIDTKLTHLFHTLYTTESTKPEDDQNYLFELCCTMSFTVPPDLEGYVLGIRPNMDATDLWDRLAKWKKSSFYNPPEVPKGLITDPDFRGAWEKIWEERRKTVGCRLYSLGDQPAVKTEFIDVNAKTEIEFREYCDDGILSRNPAKGPAFIILKCRIYSEWAFLQGQAKKCFAKAEPTIEALQQIEAGILGQGNRSAECGKAHVTQPYVDAALTKIRAQMAAMRGAR